MSRFSLDYSSFSEPVSDEMVKQYAANDVSWLTKKTIITISIVLFLFMSVPLVIGTLSSGEGITGSSIFTLFMIAAFTVAAVAAAAYGAKLQARDTVRMKRFAERNNAVFRQNITSPGLNGMIFDEGHTRYIEDSLSFTNGIEIGNYTCVKGSGKNRVTYNYSYARVALSRNLPHMVLDAKSNNFLGSNLPDRFDTSQRLALEGDFNNHFDVYVPGGYERDALYVFTPDVMQVLVDKGSCYDIEIVEDELFIFKTGKMTLSKQSDLEGFMEIAESIATELKDQSKRYVDERALQTPGAGAQNVRAAVAKPMIASEGRRLRQERPVFALLFFGFFLVVLFLPPFLPINLSDTLVAIGWPLIFLALIGYAFKNYMHSR